MKLRGLVWFFTIALTVVSLWQLSYTFVVRNYEGKVKAQAEKTVKNTAPANATPEEKAILLSNTTQRILDSTRDKKIFPLLGTTYQKSKENELNLGLDLQGGMSVTMDVNLTGMLKSLSNDSKNPGLIAALNTATTQKANSEQNFIELFSKAYSTANGSGKLAALFSGSGKEVKITDTDEQVTAKLEEIGKGAINQTYKIISKRIDKFGLTQPSINLDQNKGIINVELAGVKDPARVEGYLTTTANLQFWELYDITELDNILVTADKNLQNYLNGVSATDTSKKDDSTAANKNPFLRVLNPMGPQKDANGKEFLPSAIGNVLVQDRTKFEEYIKLDVVKNALPQNLMFLFGSKEAVGTAQTVLPVYAIKMQAGTEKAPLEGDAIQSAQQSYDQKGKPSINMQMNPNGTKIWARMTEKSKGKPIAIVLDSVVYSAPNVNDPITGGNSEISGNFTVEQAQDLASVLTSGKLDAPAKIVAKQIVGPTLGQEALNGGALSFMIAFAVIFILMLVYYNNAGWIANIALIFNLLFTIGVLIIMGFTLTAAGIAGMVLTIGIAVDTNVIIFERIKDELSKGKNYQQAVNDGYRKSLPPVLDAHITSLLTACILFYFGLGPVLGFATTQIIGILLSLFCGILVSRLITEVWTNKQRHFNYFTALSRRLFKKANYNFIGMRKYAYVLSVIILILGIASYFVGFHQGVEFKGGRSYTVAFDKNVTSSQISEMREDYKTKLDDNVVIKTVGDDKHLNITTAYLIDKTDADEAVQTKLFEGLQKYLPAGLTYQDFVAKNIQGKQTVLPSISDDLKRGAVKATVIAMFAIFMYIFLRFRDWRYSLGTIFTLLHDVFVTLIVFAFFKNIVPFPLEIDQHFIAAILTVIGFSMNDTVIVFDRIRENSRDMKGATKETIINRAINDTLSRTIMTSLTVFITVLILFIFGGEVTKGFAFAMLIGILTGTYSSIFVGAPVLVDFAKNKPLGAAKSDVKKEKAPAL